MRKKIFYKCSLLFVITLMSVKVSHSQSTDREKPGTCPEFAIPTSELCVIECNKDNECPGDNKCCTLISCGSICTSPLVPTPTTNKDAVTPAPSADCQNDCDNSRSCGTSSLCVRQGCKRICKSFGSTKVKLTSPSRVTAQIPFIRTRNCTDQCLRDAHCEVGYVCVPVGCRNVCEQRSVVTNTGQHSSDTGQRSSEDCNDRCVRDIHCPFGYECIQMGCRKVCSILPTKNPTLVQLPTHRSDECQRVCTRDTDCPQGRVCIQQGCRTFCISYSPKTTVQTSVLLPTLPVRQQLTKNMSTDCRQDCNVDADCMTGFNCRIIGCKRMCKYEGDGFLPMRSIPFGPTMDASGNHKCHNECNIDLDCKVGLSCRQQGCRRICKQDNLSITSSSTGLQCTNRCESNTDCSFGSSCLQTGCQKDCTENFVTSTPQSIDCRDECIDSKQCRQGFACIQDGCKRICQKYEISSHAHLTGINNICRIECIKNSDCLTGYDCKKDGCSTFCVINNNKQIETNPQDECKDQCTGSSECSNDSICTRRGCNRQCISISSFMAAGPASPFLRGGSVHQILIGDNNPQTIDRSRNLQLSLQQLRSQHQSSNRQESLFK